MALPQQGLLALLMGRQAQPEAQQVTNPLLQFAGTFQPKADLPNTPDNSEEAASENYNRDPQTIELRRIGALVETGQIDEEAAMRAYRKKWYGDKPKYPVLPPGKEAPTPYGYPPTFMRPRGDR